jgi:hypothetical protein
MIDDVHVFAIRCVQVVVSCDQTGKWCPNVSEAQSMTSAISAAITLSPAATAAWTVGMQNGDDGAAFGINNKDHAIHPLPVGRWNGAGQSSELPATDHERPTSASHKRTAVSTGKNCLQSLH